MSKSNKTKSPKMDMQENKQMFLRNSFEDMNSEKTDFPRGGNAFEYSVKNGRERKHKEDLLYEDHQDNRSSDEEIEKEKPVKKKRKLKSSKLAKDSDSNFDNIDNKLKYEKNLVEPLSIQHLNVGSYFLGRIIQINSMNLVVSLPCQMTGYVSINEISRSLSKIITNIADADENEEDDEEDGENEKENDENLLPELSSLFKIGQWVRCKVSRIETPNDKASKHWRVHLALIPDEVNSDIITTDLSRGMIISASVESVEDHGYILSIGLNGIDGFLHNEDAKNYIKNYNNGNELAVGRVIIVSVIKMLDNKRTVKVTADPEIVAKAKISDAEVHNICSLLPGNLVTSIVTDICSNGIRVKIMGLLNGVIDLFHAGPKIMTDLQEFHDNFKVGKKIYGRIIYVSFTTEAKRIRLSLLPHVVKLEQPKSDIEKDLVGKIIENATVKRVDGRKGVLLEIENIDINGYLRFKSGSDPNHNNELKSGSTHRARVIGFETFDNLLLLSTKKSVIEQKYFRFEDVNIGDVTECKILNIIESGILVSLSDNITALAPNIHLSDTMLTNPSQKFKIGTTHKCRILNKDPTNNYIYITFRPILINSDLPMFKSFNDVKVGTVTHGIIYGIIGQGCNVYFSGGLKAFVPINQCGVDSIKNPKNHFQVGQIVKCKITKIVNDKELIMGSFQINDNNNDLSEINLGDMKKGKILQIKDDEIILSLIPSQIRAHLSISHFSDHTTPSHLSHIQKQLRLDDVLTNLMVIAKNEQKGFVNVTKKPLLIEAKKNGKFPEKLDDVEEGNLVCGFVKSVTDYAVFVGFLGGFSAKATRERLADHYIASPVGIFHVNQSVVCLITRIHKETSRCEISLKPSIVSINEPFIKNGNFIKSYFEELLHTNKKSSSQEEMKVMIGERVKCLVKKRLSSEQDDGDIDMINDDHGGWKVEIISDNENITEKKIRGLISEEQANTKSDIKEGDQIEGIILDMDMKGKNVDLGIGPELFSFEKNGKRKNKSSTGDGVNRKELKKLLNEKTSIDAIIEQVKEDYIIVSLPKQSNIIAFAASKSFNNRSSPFMKYQFGQTIKVQITNVPHRHHKNSLNNSENNSSTHHNKHTLQYRVLVSIITSTDNDDKLIISGTKTIDDFAEGQIIKGTVSGVESYGIFIKIEDSIVSGLCHKSKISDDYVSDVSDLFKVGDKVKAKILNIDKEKQNVGFVMRKSYFDSDDQMDTDESDSEDDQMEIDEDKPSSINLQWETDSDDQNSDNAKSEENITHSQNEQSEVAPLSIFSSWKWEAKDDDDDSNNNQTQEETPPSSSDHELESGKSSQKKKRKKKKSNQLEIEDKTGDLTTQKPEVNADYERLLLGSPNSSYLWIQYMSHLLNLSEFDKAREIGERALKTINYKEEQEKMNVWIALMNLENNYGSDETMAEVFKKALQACNQKKIYMVLVEIYEKSDKFELTEQAYHTMTKKFSQSSKVWNKMGLYYIRHGKIEAFRNLLQKSLKSLPKRKHVKTITKFARMEFEYGEAERGRTIFEGMMNNYPKRLDLWSIYIDMEIKAGANDNTVRRLFQRVVNLKFSTRQMKFLFKKWLKFEMEHGNDEQIEEVKEKAKAIAESMN